MSNTDAENGIRDILKPIVAIAVIVIFCLLRFGAEGLVIVMGITVVLLFCLGSASLSSRLMRDPNLHEDKCKEEKDDE